MRMVTSSCYVHDVDGSHVCLEVLIVSMMMMMMLMMMMMVGRLCRSYAHTSPITLALPAAADLPRVCLAALATRVEGLRGSIARLLISKNASTALDYRAVSYQLLYIICAYYKPMIYI